MAEFTKNDLRELLNEQIGPLISIIMPVAHTGSDNNENKTRLENLLNRAAEMLSQMGLSRTDIKTILDPAYDYLTPPDTYQGNGLAMFVSTGPTVVRLYNMQTAIQEEQVIVGDRFYVKPLMPELINQRIHYYLITLSQRQAKLLEGTNDELHEIEISGMPQGMDDALMLEHDAYREGRKNVGQSGRPDAAGTQGGIGGMKGSHAGHGAGDSVQGQEYILDYFRKIDDVVFPYLRDKTDPLIIVATEELHPLYKQVSSYKNIMDEGIYGNPTGFTAKDLIDRAIAIVRPLLDKTKQDAMARYGEYITKNLASNKLLDVLKSAYMGQIETLFVPLETEIWGTYDFTTEKLEVHNEQHPGDVDLIDLAASQTLANAGQVFAVPREELPEVATVAAVFRYSL